jgi:hypothetical protein
MELNWAEDRAPVGTDPSADPGVVSEVRVAATPPPTSLAPNTKAINPNRYAATRLPSNQTPLPR